MRNSPRVFGGHNLEIAAVVKECAFSQIMAGKRAATTDLNHDNWNEEIPEEEAGVFTPASQEALGTRVIKRAKRRLKGDGDVRVFLLFGISELFYFFQETYFQTRECQICNGIRVC